MTWTNGYIPEDDLIIFRRGWNETDGDWYWGLTPATFARHNALVRRAQERTGRTLEPTEGYGTYRPYGAQVIARRMYGNGAAVPGTSSHGGFWEGRETLAIDYGNWAWVYDGDRGAFYADCRAVGLTPGMISRERGYPDEPWHVIDLSPREMPAYANATSFEKEEEDMLSDADRALLADVRALITDVHVALGAGGASEIPVQDRTDRSVLAHVRATVGALGRIEPRIVNIDQQVTGADDFDAKIGPSVAGRLIAVQQAVANLDAPAVDIAHLDTLSTEALDELVKRLLEEQSKRHAS